MAIETTLTVILVQEGLDPEDRPWLKGQVVLCDTLYEAVALWASGDHRPTVLIVSAWTWFKAEGFLGRPAPRQGIKVICWMKHPWDVTRLLKASPGGNQPDAMVFTEQQVSAVLQRIIAEQVPVSMESLPSSTITLDHCEISTQEKNALLTLGCVERRACSRADGRVFRQNQEPDQAGVIGGV